MVRSGNADGRPREAIVAEPMARRYGGLESVSPVPPDFHCRVLGPKIASPYLVDMSRLIDHQTKFIAVMGGPASFSDQHQARKS